MSSSPPKPRNTSENTAAPISGVEVIVFDETGYAVGADTTDSVGIFTVWSLHPGTYFVATDDRDYSNEIYNDLPCPSGCDPTVGTPVAVAEATTTGPR